MLVSIEAPAPIEVRSLTVKQRSIEISPLPIRGQQLLRIGYLSAKGDNGSDSKAILYFNGKTGEFVVSRVTQSAQVPAFDSMTADDFEAQQQETLKKKAAAAKTAASQSPASTPRQAAAVTSPVIGEINA